MFNRIFSITMRDFKSNVREFILLYILVAPFLLAFGLTAFVPSLESTSVQFAVDKSVEESMISHLEQYGSVNTYASLTELKQRLVSIDEVIGIINNNGNHEILLYGDEREGTEVMVSKIIRHYESGFLNEGAYKFSSIGVKESPVALIGTISLILMALALGGGIIGLNIIEEKEEKTVRAIVVSPVNRFEFIVGKSLTGAITSVVQTFGILMIVGYMQVDMLQILFFTLVGLSILVLFGFLIGVFSSNQIMGLANLKFLFFPISISVIGAIVIPKAWQFTLYWSPFYWSYRGYSEILLGTAAWTDLALYSGCILVVFVAILAFTRNKIIDGLS